MRALFFTVIRMSIIGSYVIVFVLALRLLLRRLPRRFSCLLWSLVFLRLLCPVFPQSSYSFIPKEIPLWLAGDLQSPGAFLKSQGDFRPEGQALGGSLGDSFLVKAWEEKSSGAEEIRKAEGFGETGKTGDLGSKRGEPLAGQSYLGEEEQTGEGGVSSWALTMAPGLWLAGFLGFLLYHGGSYWRLKKSVAALAVCTKPGPEAVYELPQEHLSFVLGIFHPAIYLAAGLKPEARQYILCHEQVHLCRRDYLLKPLALFITCMHWFNPLVWLAFHLLNQDMEISCDERVISLLGEESKKAYSQTLLDAAAGGRGPGKGSVCALLSFGEDSVKTRIRHVLAYKKAPFWLLAVLGAGLLALAVGLLFNPKASLSEEEFLEAIYTAGGYDRAAGLETVCLIADYEKDGQKEAYVQIGQSLEDCVEGELWFVSETGEAFLKKEQVLLRREQEFFDYGKGMLLLVTYAEGDSLETAVYGVSEGFSAEQLPSQRGEKYVENGQIVCLQSSYDASYDRETEAYKGHTSKPYGFYCVDGFLFPYVASPISREEVKSLENGQAILEELESSRPGCSYEYLLRENGLLHINQAEDLEESLRFSYYTYEVREERLLFLEEGEGCYQKDMTAPHEKSFAASMAEQLPDGNESWLGTMQERRAFGEEIRRCLEQEDWVALYPRMSQTVLTNLQEEAFRLDSVETFLAACDRIFLPEVVQSVLDTDMKELFSNWQGVNLGDVIWFQPRAGENGELAYEIYAVNGLAQEEIGTAGTELFQEWLQLAKERGLSEEEAGRFYTRLQQDGFPLEESYEFGDLQVGLWDGNTQLDLALVMNLRPGAITPKAYPAAWLGIYLNGELAYQRIEPEQYLYGLENLLAGDVDQDGIQELLYLSFTGGVGGTGSWFKEILKCGEGHLEPMAFPDDLGEEWEAGLSVEVRLGAGGAGADRYRAYCPFVDKQVEFEGENLRLEGGGLVDPYAREGALVGGNIRGYYMFSIVVREGRLYLEAREALYGEGGPSHLVGNAVFLLDWTEEGIPQVVDFTVEPI